MIIITIAIKAIISTMKKISIALIFIPVSLLEVVFQTHQRNRHVSGVSSIKPKLIAQTVVLASIRAHLAFPVDYEPRESYPLRNYLALVVGHRILLHMGSQNCYSIGSLTPACLQLLLLRQPGGLSQE